MHHHPIDSIRRRDSMTTMTKHAAGTFCWTPARHSRRRGALKKFYAGLFGLETRGRRGRRAPVHHRPQAGQGDRRDHGISNPALRRKRWTSFVAVRASTDPITARVRQAGGHVCSVEPRFDDRQERTHEASTIPPAARSRCGRPAPGSGAEVMHEPGCDDLERADHRRREPGGRCSMRAGARLDPWRSRRASRGMPYTMKTSGASDPIGRRVSRPRPR